MVNFDSTAALRVSRSGRAQKLDQSDQQPVASDLVKTASWNTSELELPDFFNLTLKRKRSNEACNVPKRKKRPLFSNQRVSVSALLLGG